MTNYFNVIAGTIQYSRTDGISNTSVQKVIHFEFEGFFYDLRIVEIFFEQLVDFTTWQASGGYIEGDDQKELRSYANVDFSRPYTLEGFGEYTGSNVTVLSNTDFHHMDIGPRDVYGDYGIGFWISYEGTVNGQAVGGEASQHIDMYAALEDCVNRRSILLVREWTVTDAAGNTAVYIQRVEAEE